MPPPQPLAASQEAVIAGNRSLEDARPFLALAEARRASLLLDEIQGYEALARRSAAADLEARAWLDIDELELAELLARRAVSSADAYQASLPSDPVETWSGLAHAARLTVARVLEARGDIDYAETEYRSLRDTTGPDDYLLARLVACSLKRGASPNWRELASRVRDPFEGYLVRPRLANPSEGVLARWLAIAAIYDQELDQAEQFLSAAHDAGAGYSRGVLVGAFVPAFLYARRGTPNDRTLAVETFLRAARNAAGAGLRRHVRIAFEPFQRLLS